MKKALALLVIITSSFTAMAQDTILMTNGSRVPSKIMEVSPNDVKYKRTDNIDGPTFVTNKSEIAIIKYSNGVADTLNKVKPKVVVTSTPPVDYVTAAPKLYPVGSKYMYGDKRISENQMYNMMLAKKDPELAMHVRKAKLGKGGRYIGFLAIPAMVGGITYFVIEATGVRTNASGGPGAANRDYTPAIAFTAVGVACLTTSIVFSSSYKAHNRAAVKIYNQKY
jgi:hypothetical protein